MAIFLGSPRVKILHGADITSRPLPDLISVKTWNASQISRFNLKLHDLLQTNIHILRSEINVIENITIFFININWSVNNNGWNG